MASLVVHVGAGIDTLLGELRERDLKTLLNRLQNSLVFGAANEGDTETLGSETTSTTDTVEVGVSLVWHVVVDGDVDALNIDTTTEDVSGHTDTGLEILELLVAFDTVSSSACDHCTLVSEYVPLLLANTRVDCSTGEVALAQKLVKLCASQSRTNEDNDLVELQLVEEIVELSVLLTLIKLHVVLLQAVECQLLLVVDINLKRVLHELLAGLADLLRQGG